MFLYMDSSALIKLYIGEPGTHEVERAVAEAQSVATSWVSYPEARSAFARLFREGHLSAVHLRLVVSALDKDLPAYDLVLPDEDAWREAGRLAERLGIRALDAVHLSSATSLPGEDVRMMTFDERLLAAARKTMEVYET